MQEACTRRRSIVQSPRTRPAMPVVLSAFLGWGADGGMHRAQGKVRLAVREHLMDLRNWVSQGGNRWMWLCPFLALVLAALVLLIWGFSLWTAIVIALLLVCPALLIWGVFYLSRH